MNSLFKELKGKDIRIKTWGEMLEMENTSLFKDRVILFLDNYGNAFTNFPSTAEHLCGKIIKVDETMITDGLFKVHEGGLEEDRELLYYDEENDNCYYLDKDMFEVLEESKLKALEEPELKDENEFYVIEETTGKRIFCGTREECFKYYKTHVDELKKQGKRIAALKEI